MTDWLDGVENVLSEMIREKYPEGALVGAWIVSCEVLTMEANEDSRALWFLEGRGSLITRRGLIELSRDVLARTVKETDE